MIGSSWIAHILLENRTLLRPGTCCIHFVTGSYHLGPLVYCDGFLFGPSCLFALFNISTCYGFNVQKNFRTMGFLKDQSVLSIIIIWNP